MKKTLITTLVGLFLLGITSTAMATVPIVSAIDWLGNSSIGWVKLVTDVTNSAGSYKYDYSYTLSFEKDATHTKYYYEGTSQDVMGFKVMNPFQLPVFGTTTPTGWNFSKAIPYYYKWYTEDINYMVKVGSPKTFVVSTDYLPSRVAASAWDGGTAAEGMTYGPVPEPCSMLLLGMGVLGLFGLGRKKT